MFINLTLRKERNLINLILKFNSDIDDVEHCTRKIPLFPNFIVHAVHMTFWA